MLDLNDYTSLEKLLSKLDDDVFWKPVKGEKLAIEQFDEHIELIEASQDWGKAENHKKGAVLENFAMFLFSRFQDVQVFKNKRPGDNETDIEAIMSEKALPPFIKNIIGQRIICECKNKKSSTIDVGMVTKLAEIIPTRGSNFGIFISIKGMGGQSWRFGEGKRKKIMYSHQLPLISFTVDELKEIKEGRNFYTMIKEKYYALLDEVDDNTSGIPLEEEDFIKYTLQMVEHFKKCELLNDEEERSLLMRLSKRYGLQ
ncbi:restriction endonuclease [Sporosarcina sp. 179-K 3D1 HS]|uniref:restriction endonuclease n=1 Tax=Sporosarcina sp. 179-K 3D1 HS TaxID=3232169 RepID=UPI0039A19248